MYKSQFTHREWLEWKRLKKLNPDHMRRAVSGEGHSKPPSNVKDMARFRFSGNY